MALLLGDIKHFTFKTWSDGIRECLDSLQETRQRRPRECSSSSSVCVSQIRPVAAFRQNVLNCSFQVTAVELTFFCLCNTANLGLEATSMLEDSKRLHQVLSTHLSTHREQVSELNNVQHFFHNTDTWFMPHLSTPWKEHCNAPSPLQSHLSMHSRVRPLLCSSD
jgi:hypothetical protein